MLRTFPFALLLLVAGAHAQQRAVEPPSARPEQRIERITHEDAGSRIDELRVGGQTESIDVKPKGGAPAYAVDPANQARSRPGDQRNGLSSAGGRTSWTVLPF
jgi:hypothetical protein